MNVEIRTLGELENAKRFTYAWIQDELLKLLGKDSRVYCGSRPQG